ncbi:transcription regulator, SpoVT/AbrB family [Thermococcus kodakarensis KOD1]|uniref:Transcription regulator, SpoVT/AbrB family n=1 Tax=Thermococcus kodakarensis (strain ATCC BAA-918 / JCM 12380 / KOD1) TaxID=69014 RepID=Q5JEJ2_THEKO|nr:AbrB/MazE/SpoVT family DNA-binding domain-containing protein [Thermococcus kodakarensis]WCN28208.1 AbrB/MazE/SpoVT family DNA-binding domain-containing protein [Thermococcus kodakarensis]WCN30505.1 AbrB/MazE/SpoVT family DNA-binding domain-containing protein [Thermococcus kodakarensis]BAD84283.1 transcription regulator, SpoVT/AbrB family [Thermococcus kodakarensis KOD1]
MPDQDTSKARVAEPLAKFHARLDRDGRVTIPRHVRTVFHINKDDYIKATIRRVYVDLGLKTIFILGEDTGVIMRVGRGGMVTIPQKVREELQLDPGDLVEVIIENVFKLKTGYEREFRYVRETKK